MKHLIMMINNWLISLGIVTAVCCLASPVQAVTFVGQPDVFTPDTWLQPTDPETHYGTLSGWPHTFIFRVVEPTEFAYQLATKPGDNPVSLLLVREQIRGVSEVARLVGDQSPWYEIQDSRFGLKLSASDVLRIPLEPGTYRLEVSNPVNEGRYQIAINGGTQAGFFATMRQSLQVHNFYGSWVTALFTWPFLLMFALAGLSMWWVRRLLT
jgi:hypothetical protein